jgi:hypothetical protein
MPDQPKNAGDERQEARDGDPELNLLNYVSEQQPRYVTPDERVVLAKQILELFGSGPFSDSSSLLLATESVVVTAVELLRSFLSEEPADPEMLRQARRRRDTLRAMQDLRDQREKGWEVKENRD